MNSSKPEHDTIGSIGEREFLRRIQEYLSPVGETIHVTIGDDAAVVAGSSEQLVLTTDMLVEGVHFLRSDATAWYRLGRKALTSNVSDIGAMGAFPRYALISIGIPAGMPVNSLLGLYRGMRDEAAAWNALLVGGDTTRSPVLMISIALIGSVPEDQHLPVRSGCREGQNVYVTGTLGGSRAGLDILTGTKTPQIEASDAESLILAHQAPCARADLGAALASSLSDLAMIDISDSLHNELHLLSEASDVGFEIELSRVPIQKALHSLDTCEARRYALFSGEEYQLLFTTFAKPADIINLLRSRGLADDISLIGKVDGGNHVKFIDGDGAERLFNDATFSHFTGKREELK